MTERNEFINIDLDYLPRLPQDKSVGIGCIGSGFIMADCHLVAYRKAGFNPVAIVSDQPDQARKVAEQHQIANVYNNVDDLLQDETVKVVDIAVPPDVTLEMVRKTVKYAKHVRGILCQKPMGTNYAQASEIVALCKKAQITLAVNQNMRYDQSIRACKCLLDRGYLGEPVLATIEMRAVLDWPDWCTRLGFGVLRLMSIHHLDMFRYWFGDPELVFASVRSDPRLEKRSQHKDGICLYILEWANGLRACGWDDVWCGPVREGVSEDSYIHWRLEGTEGIAKGTIGWPDYPAPTPSTIDFSTKKKPGYWFQPRRGKVWFPDAFVGTMAQLLCALEENHEPQISGQDNLKTMALVDACYRSVEEHRAVKVDT